MSQTVANAKDDAPSAGTKPDRHPAGLYILFASEMWERFGFYTAAAVMTLYLQRGGFGWSKTQATSLWSNYLMFVYATPSDRRLAGRQVPGLSPLGAAGRRVLHRRVRPARLGIAGDLSISPWA